MIYLTLFIEFFKVGLFSFGGGFGMIPLIQDNRFDAIQKALHVGIFRQIFYNCGN